MPLCKLVLLLCYASLSECAWLVRRRSLGHLLHAEPSPAYSS